MSARNPGFRGDSGYVFAIIIWWLSAILKKIRILNKCDDHDHDVVYVVDDDDDDDNDDGDDDDGDDNDDDEV